MHYFFARPRVVPPNPPTPPRAGFAALPNSVEPVPRVPAPSPAPNAPPPTREVGAVAAGNAVDLLPNSPPVCAAPEKTRRLSDELTHRERLRLVSIRKYSLRDNHIIIRYFRKYQLGSCYVCNMSQFTNLTKQNCKCFPFTTILY